MDHLGTCMDGSELTGTNFCCPREAELPVVRERRNCLCDLLRVPRPQLVPKVRGDVSHSFFVHGGVPEDVPSQLQNTRDGWSWGLGPSQPHSREHSRLAAPHSRHRCAATAPLPFLGKGKRQELLNFNSRMMT